MILMNKLCVSVAVWVILETSNSKDKDTCNSNSSGTVNHPTEEVHNSVEPPPPDSARSPCPALNTLANHGYINRDGRNIYAGDILQ